MLQIDATTIKQAIRKMLPQFLLTPVQNYRIRKAHSKRFENLATQQIFTKIYEDGAWGTSHEADRKLYSGWGSDDAVVDLYLVSVRKALSSIELLEHRKPDVVDLGCGDFNVGSKLRQFCGSYVACDIVAAVVSKNKEKYKHLDVDFRVLDLTRDELPAADIVFVRQVFQHLSNDQISRSLLQITSKYRYLVLTEHLPSSGFFTPNLDIPGGIDIRRRLNSGVVLTCAPFHLKARESTCLCEVSRDGNLIRTTLYRIN